MPGQDQTGPAGEGPMTGRRLGPCVTHEGTTVQPIGRGFRCGRGCRQGRNAGLGRGFGRGFGHRV